jgi:predicted DNA-binding transcriptional regulator YafY
MLLEQGEEALGRHAIDLRLLPFTDTLESALDKVRSALSTSAQRDLLARLEELTFLGVPALPAKKAVREAVERAWFEQQPLRVVYVDRHFAERQHEVRIRSVQMDRHETRLEAVSLDGDEHFRFRLDHIVHAEVLHFDTTRSAR